METISNWISKQAKRQGRYVSVFEALLARNPASYLFYRLRYFIIVTTIGLAAHLVEFSLLYFFLKSQQFISIITFKIIFGLLSGGWWGALEIMRERIRRFYASMKKREIGIEITFWLIIGMTLQAILVLATLPISYITFVHLAAGQFTLYDLYIVTIIFQSSCALWVRTLHSGCLAINRVFRPLSSIIIYDITSMVIILALLDFIHAYALPVGIIISTIVNVRLSLHYNFNMYRFLNIKPFRLPRPKHFIKRLRQIFSSELLAASCSSLIMQIENVVVLILLLRSIHHSHMAEAGVLIYFVSPLIRASFNWIKLFYYDLKKYSHPLFANMVANLNRYIMYSGFILVVVFWVISVLLSLAYNIYNISILLMLFPLFLLRAELAHWQMHRFTAMRYGDVMISGAIACIGVIIAASLELNIYYILLIILIFMLLGLISLGFVKTGIIETDAYHPPEMPFYIWLYSIKKLKPGFAIFQLTFAETKSAQRAKNFLRHIHEQMSRSRKMTRVDKSSVYICEKIAASNTPSRLNDLNTMASGCVMTSKITNSIYPAVKLENLNKNSVETFQQNYPNGICFDLVNPNIALLQHFDQAALGEIFYQLMHFLKRPLAEVTQSEYSVCASIIQQRVRYLYLLPRKYYQQSECFNWQSIVHYQNAQDLVSTDKPDAPQDHSRYPLEK